MNQPNSNMDNKSLAIGVLGITAAIFFVGFLLLAVTPRTAQASRMNASGGDYVVSTQQISGARELLVVMDAASKQMLVYSFQVGGRTKEVSLVDRIDFNRLDDFRTPRR